VIVGVTMQDADKGYHGRTTVHDLERLEIRTYISEPDRASAEASPSTRFDAEWCQRFSLLPRDIPANEVLACA
jgi:hypothetical protein